MTNTLHQKTLLLSVEKSGLHPRNRHRARYDFEQLTRACPELAAYILPTRNQISSIDFSNPAAVKALNKALLLVFYALDYWDIPAGYLCPPVPGRADYIHYMADLLAENYPAKPPHGNPIQVLDIGVGANCIYPIIGHREYGWHFVGTDIDPVALAAAKQIASANAVLSRAVEFRLQKEASDIFNGVVKPGEWFDLAICNPPFHESAEAAAAGTERKWKNLGIGKSGAVNLNFGGQPMELWYPGGEQVFVQKMIEQSAAFADACGWYSTLVSKKSNLARIYKMLKKVRAAEVRTIEMAQGQKTSRIVAWMFHKKSTAMWD